MHTAALRHVPATETDLERRPDRDPRLVLELDNARASLGRGMNLAQASLSLAPGAFELMDAEDAGQAAAFADLCSGLIDPTAGAVRFLGHDWREAPHDYANALRGRIGRVFAEEAWAPHLTLAENILLQQRHHTRRVEEEMLAEASALAQAFGLPGIPVSRPEEATPFDRVRAALARAFLGDPALVLLEHPLQGRYAELLEPLVNVIGRARRRGAAVLWLTLTPATWAMRNLPTTGRLRLSEARLVRASPMAVSEGGLR
jgi:phospholipid/cholesterol/gamma-HCH transport system ATP-binding protein